MSKKKKLYTIAFFYANPKFGESIGIETMHGENEADVYDKFGEWFQEEINPDLPLSDVLVLVTLSKELKPINQCIV